MKLRNLKMNESIEKQYQNALESDKVILEPTEANALEVEAKKEEEIKDDFKEQDKIADEVAKDTNATEVNEPKKVKDRKELSKLLSEAKESGKQLKVSRCNEDGFRYLVEWVEPEEIKETLVEEKEVCPECGKEVCECDKQSVEEELKDEDDVFDLNSDLYHAIKDVVKKYLDKGISSDDLDSAYEFCTIHMEDDEEIPDDFFKNPTWGKKEEPKEEVKETEEEVVEEGCKKDLKESDARPNHDRVLNALDQGLLSYEEVAKECLSEMADDDIEDMIHICDWDFCFAKDESLEEAKSEFKSAGQVMNENPEWQSELSPEAMRQSILKVLDSHKEEMEPKNYNYARMTFEKANRNAIFGLVAAFTTGDAINPNKEHKQNVKDLDDEFTW